MTSAEQKETVLNFIKAIGASDVSAMAPMLTDDFEFEVMARMPAMPSIIKKADLLGDFGKTVKQMFPNGLKTEPGRQLVPSYPAGLSVWKPFAASRRQTSRLRMMKSQEQKGR